MDQVPCSGRPTCKRPIARTLLVCKAGGTRQPTAAMLANNRKTTAAGRLIDYARVSTEEQGTDPQRDEQHVAGCTPRSWRSTPLAPIAAGLYGRPRCATSPPAKPWSW
jgi:hypothetical protein